MSPIRWRKESSVAKRHDERKPFGFPLIAPPYTGFPHGRVRGPRKLGRPAAHPAALDRAPPRGRGHRALSRGEIRPRPAGGGRLLLRLRVFETAGRVRPGGDRIAPAPHRPGGRSEEHTSE